MRLADDVDVGRVDEAEQRPADHVRGQVTEVRNAAANDGPVISRFCISRLRHPAQALPQINVRQGAGAGVLCDELQLLVGGASLRRVGGSAKWRLWHLPDLVEMTAPWKNHSLEGIAGDAGGSCGAFELALQLAGMAHAAAETHEDETISRFHQQNPILLSHVTIFPAARRIV